MVAVRGGVIALGLLLLWQLIVWIFQLPPYILPSPALVLQTWVMQMPLLLQQTWPTLLEMLLGLLLGMLIGVIGALSMAYWRPVRAWMLPVLLVSQAVPTFAIAPLLVIWFGYGMSAKIITTMLILFYPVTSAFYDGLRRTPSGWLDLAKTMNAKRWHSLWYVRVPSALPAFASGMRVAAAAAPIGAIIGEWVGASRGLGFLMLNANARMQIDLMFAALFMIVLLALLLYFGVDALLRRLIVWQVHS